MNKSLKLATLVAGIACAPMAANATPTISVFANTTGTVPTLPTDNEVLNNTLVGSFTASVLAQGEPLPANGILDATAIQVAAAAGAGTLYIWVTETGLTSPVGSLTFQSGFENNALSTGSVTEMTYLDTADTGYEDGTPLSSESVAVGEDNSLLASASTGAGPYSVTEEFVVTDGAAGVNDTDTIQLSTVPEPTSLALLGSGLIGLGAALRRRRKSV